MIKSARGNKKVALNTKIFFIMERPRFLNVEVTEFLRFFYLSQLHHGLRHLYSRLKRNLLIIHLLITLMIEIVYLLVVKNIFSLVISTYKFKSSPN